MPAAFGSVSGALCRRLRAAVIAWLPFSAGDGGVPDQPEARWVRWLCDPHHRRVLPLGPAEGVDAEAHAAAILAAVQDMGTYTPHAVCPAASLPPTELRDRGCVR
jgi:hypothetical protein